MRFELARSLVASSSARWRVVTMTALALAAFLNARAISELVGAEVALDVSELATALDAPAPPSEEVPPRSPTGRPILERNPFEHSASFPRASVHAEGPRRGAERASPKSTEAPIDPEPSDGIHAVRPGEFVIEHDLVERVLASQTNVSRLAKAVQVREEGRVVGVKLTRVDGLLARLGIQNGDEIRSVNGYEVGTADKAFAAYAGLANAKRLSVELRRSGAIVHLGYTID